MEVIQTILLSMILVSLLWDKKPCKTKIEVHKPIFKPPKPPKKNPELERINKILDNIEAYDGSAKNQQKVR